jgi:hypothetical protein
MPYQLLFDSNFTIGQIYSRQEIEDLFTEHRINNPTAFTYNRWNIGQTDLNCYFEYLGKARYKYLGLNFAFSGPCFHHPQGKGYYKVGDWLNGHFTYSDSVVKDFASWKAKYRDNESGLNVYLAVQENCPFEIQDLSTKKIQKRIISHSSSKFVDEFNVISPGSNLSKLIINKIVNHQFAFGPNEFKIIKIHNKITK